MQCSPVPLSQRLPANLIYRTRSSPSTTRRSPAATHQKGSSRSQSTPRCRRAVATHIQFLVERSPSPLTARTVKMPVLPEEASPSPARTCAAYGTASMTSLNVAADATGSGTAMWCQSATRSTSRTSTSMRRLTTSTAPFATSRTAASRASRRNNGGSTTGRRRSTGS